jgi:hypothetical protein
MVYIYNLITLISENVSSQGRLIQKMPSNEEQLIVMRRQINVYIDQTTDRDGLFGHLCSSVI